MSQKNGTRDPDEIESEISQTRASLDDTLQELENRLSPKQFMDSAYYHVRNGGANEFLASLGETIKQNPIPVLLTGIGLGWLMMAHRQTNQRPYARSGDEDDEATEITGYRSVTTPAASTSASPTANSTVRTAGTDDSTAPTATTVTSSGNAAPQASKGTATTGSSGETRPSHHGGSS